MSILKFTTLILILFTFQNCSNTQGLISYSKIDLCSKVTVKNNSVIFSAIDEFTFSKINSKGPDNPKEYNKIQECIVGETLRINSIGYNLYWDVLQIDHDKVKLHYFGFIRNKGNVNETLWIKSY